MIDQNQGLPPLEQVPPFLVVGIEQVENRWVAIVHIRTSINPLKVERKELMAGEIGALIKEISQTVLAKMKVLNRPRLAKRPQLSNES